MTIQELQDRGAICFDKIRKGFENYRDVKLKMDEKRAIRHFKSLRDEYGPGCAFADFYYFKLDEDAREMIEEELTPAEVQYIHGLLGGIEDPETDIVFPLDDTMLRVVCRLNASETLFSTIYFLSGGGRERTTWWGSYEQEYYCFKD